MRLAACCCTYLRSHLLPAIMKSWEMQDYPADQRELIILDDAGEYCPRSGPNWRLISIPHRFRSLGEKRNACAALASPDVDAYCVWDDDDWYLPHALSASAAALARAPLSRPSQVLYLDGNAFHRYRTGGLYHGGWAYTRAAFLKVNGYRAMSGPEDQDLLQRMEAAGIATADPLDDVTGQRPFYVYQNATGSPHLSWEGNTWVEGEQVWNRLGRAHSGLKDGLAAKWPLDLARVPVLDEVHPRPF